MSACTYLLLAGSRSQCDSFVQVIAPSDDFHRSRPPAYTTAASVLSPRSVVAYQPWPPRIESKPGSVSATGHDPLTGFERNVHVAPSSVDRNVPIWSTGLLGQFLMSPDALAASACRTVGVLLVASDIRPVSASKPANPGPQI